MFGDISGKGPFSFFCFHLMEHLHANLHLPLLLYLPQKVSQRGAPPVILVKSLHFFKLFMGNLMELHNAAKCSKLRPSAIAMLLWLGFQMHRVLMQ